MVVINLCPGLEGQAGLVYWMVLGTRLALGEPTLWDQSRYPEGCGKEKALGLGTGTLDFFRERSALRFKSCFRDKFCQLVLKLRGAMSVFHGDQSLS